MENCFGQNLHSLVGVQDLNSEKVILGGSYREKEPLLYYRKLERGELETD